ncbi:MAG: F0F1 ATP synthase subunit A [Bacillota bacterium]|jgi:F-type H+-transporting ATPase subunit a|nr:F0F1 ATP synthase subunit A [Eubacteriales bacterium]MDI9492273.1 F0F1 ATP synthase subunit A [Bacillota bacterium]NLV69922.1 F0F1 ATP synthase subunit A [Clostridiales bacterium]MDD3864341.1 F0F1 ATP synthase subunit A [Eubacteriales bacterium]MDD4444590.1 F0F1 ATP synthase subunit A [Eubacteriales bacterium]
MTIDPSEIVYFEAGFVRITATLVFTWVIMILLTVVSYLVTRNIKVEGEISKGQNILEALVETINGQIRQISRQDPAKYLPFVGTLFIFILASNILSIVPGFISPTGSLNTSVALSLCVFLSVPVFGIGEQGIGGYLKEYIKPTFIMLPFNIISEISRTLSLAIRLYGNVMSSSIIVAILLGVVPLFFPVVIQALGLLTGVIQAYIFAILAIVYIASATERKKKKKGNLKEES